MEKNSFLMINDMIYDLYSCRSRTDLKENFLRRLKLLIPYSYASILFHDNSSAPDTACLTAPLCIPDFFEEAENEYRKVADKDHLLWLIHSREPKVIRESDLLEENARLNSPLYLHCYRKFDIYDSLQYASVYQQNFLGVLTLFRTKSDGSFTNEDAFYLRSLGMHFNAVLHSINELENSSAHPDSVETVSEKLRRQYLLTPREAQILSMIFNYTDNNEIAESLGICETTLQKHIQNIFRKTNTASKWELLRFLR